MCRSVKELRIGMSYARADYDPKWYGMGDAAHAAMQVYPPYVSWRQEHPEEEIIDEVCLLLAATPEFEAFLAEKFPD